MPKKGDTILAADKALEEAPQDTMDQTQTTTQTAAVKLPVAGRAFLASNEAKTSHRLVWQKEGQDDWNPNRDLSLLDLQQSAAGLEAIANYVAGGVSGSPTLLFVAPVEKLAYDLGTGVFAHVSDKHDPSEGVEVNVDGRKLIIYVDERDIPTEGWRRLRLDEGVLYSSPDEPDSTRRGQVGGWLESSNSESAQKAKRNTWKYWYCKTMSAILAGRNVSVSTGPLNIDKARAVEAVCLADDPTAANDLRKFTGRQTSRDVGQAKQETEVIFATTEGGKNLVTDDASYMVPTSDGGMVSMKGWSKDRSVRWMDNTGWISQPRFLKVADDLDILGTVQMILKNGYKLVQ